MSGNAVAGALSPTRVEEGVPLLVDRLAEVLQLVMKNVDKFLDVVDDGAFSGNDLTIAAVLETKMKGEGGKV